MSWSLYVFTGGAIVLVVLALLSVGRLFLGPTSADRLVALDTINTFVVGLMILIAAITDSIIMVDVAIVYGALSFVGALFLARYMEGGV
ncbi:MAG: monovalent cation/H+ antiporter complex subunit F [Synergistaceae bacterium]|nr:monovalent cation/H+ antiporter complex subunit F [Synergistaceae bacterium]